MFFPMSRRPNPAHHVATSDGYTTNPAQYETNTIREPCSILCKKGISHGSNKANPVAFPMMLV